MLPLVPQMASIGEESGKIDEMLGKAAQVYENELDEQINNISTMIEPILMVIMAGLEFAWEDPNLSMLYRKTDEELKAVFGDDFSGSIQGITPREYMGDTYGDPATCLWGDDWAIPTLDQITELKNRMSGSKVQGAKFTDWVEWANNVVIPHVKTNGFYVYGKNPYSNKKVWFPAAGGVHSKKRGTPESPASNDGCNGVYMTATTALTSPGELPSCYVFMFNGKVDDNGNAGAFSLGCYNNTVYNFDTRIHGCSVRPVRKP